MPKSDINTPRDINYIIERQINHNLKQTIQRVILEKLK